MLSPISDQPCCESLVCKVTNVTCGGRCVWFPGFCSECPPSGIPERRLSIGNTRLVVRFLSSARPRGEPPCRVASVSLETNLHGKLSDARPRAASVSLETVSFETPVHGFLSSARPRNEPPWCTASVSLETPGRLAGSLSPPGTTVVAPPSSAAVAVPSLKTLLSEILPLQFR